MERPVSSNKNELAVRIINPVLLIAGDIHYATWMTAGYRDVFEDALKAALDTPNSIYASFRRHFVWAGPHLRAWKITILPPYYSSSRDRVKWMLRLRRICEKYSMFGIPGKIPQSNRTPLTFASTNSDLRTGATRQAAKSTLLRGIRLFNTMIIPWNSVMIYYESDIRIFPILLSRLGLMGAIFTIIAIIFLPDWKCVIIILASIVMINLNILGFMYFWSIKLNLLSTAYLLLSIGFSVSFLTQFVHTFVGSLDAHGDTKAIEALAITGSRNVHGVTALLLGFGILRLSRSSVLVTFCKMMTLVAVLRFTYCLVFLPVLLSILKPKSVCNHNGGDRNTAAERQCPSSALTERSGTWASYQSSNVTSDKHSFTSQRCVSFCDSIVYLEHDALTLTPSHPADMVKSTTICNSFVTDGYSPRTQHPNSTSYSDTT